MDLQLVSVYSSLIHGHYTRADTIPSCNKHLLKLFNIADTICKVTILLQLVEVAQEAVHLGLQIEVLLKSNE